MMRDHDNQTSEGLNQIFEIINAKGDTGELDKIVKKSNNDPNKDKGDTKT
jgi:hypothetical protein